MALYSITYCPRILPWVRYEHWKTLLDLILAFAIACGCRKPNLQTNKIGTDQYTPGNLVGSSWPMWQVPLESVSFKDSAQLVGS